MKNSRKLNLQRLYTCNALPTYNNYKQNALHELREYFKSVLFRYEKKAYLCM